MSHDQNAGQSHNTKTEFNSFNKVGEFSHLRTTLTYQNSIQEEIKNRMNSGNPCRHSVQNFLSSSLLSKNIQIMIPYILESNPH